MRTAAVVVFRARKFSRVQPLLTCRTKCSQGQESVPWKFLEIPWKFGIWVTIRRLREVGGRTGKSECRALDGRWKQPREGSSRYHLLRMNAGRW